MELVLHATKKITSSFFTLLKKFWYISLVIIAVIGFYIYKDQTAKTTTKVIMYTVKRETLQDILALSGKVEADEKVSLHFQSGGKLSWVGVKEGDSVKQYQGIASLDQRQLQKSLEKYLNTYSKERTDFDENEDVNGTGSVGFSREIRDAAKRTYERSQLDLNNAVLDVELQSIAKEYAYLYSPIDGIVTHVGVPASGVNISITDTFDIVNPETIYFSLSADQTEVVRLTNALSGIITLDAYPEETIKGTISSIAFTPTASETGTVYEVKMDLSGTEKTRYRLGMTGDVEFVLKEIPNVLTVPIEFILDENDKQYVFKQLNGKKEKVEIKTGNEYEGMMEIKDGLKESDVIYEVTK